MSFMLRKQHDLNPLDRMLSNVEKLTELQLQVLSFIQEFNEGGLEFGNYSLNRFGKENNSIDPQL